MAPTSSLSSLFLLSSLALLSHAASDSQTTTASISGTAVNLAKTGGSTYPRANLLSNGDIVGAYTGFTASSEHQLTITTSSTHGAEWDVIGTAATRPASTSDLDNGYPLQLPGGDILLAYRNHDKDANTGRYTIFRITLSISHDGGASWVFLADPVVVTVASGGDQATGVWEPLLRNTKDGVLQLYYSRENAANDQDSLLQTSSDGGKTWSEARTVSGTNITARDGMVGVTATPGSDTSLIAVFESLEPNSAFKLHTVSSSDDGATWGNRQQIYTPKANSNAGAPQIATVGDTLVVSFMTDEDTTVPHTWPLGAASKMIVSHDKGTSWVTENAITVFAQPSYWPGLLVLNDTSLLYMAESGAAKSQLVELA